MQVISVQEIIDIVIMTLAVGYIFIDLPVLKTRTTKFSWQRLKFAAMMTAPAIVLHELAHKFVGLGVGLITTFHAAYFWLGIGIVLKSLHSPLLFFVPGYVSITCPAVPCAVGPLQQAFTAVSGPLVNLALWLGAAYLLKNKKCNYRTTVLFFVTKQINMFLFIFNMLPFPIFDGFKFYQGVFLWFVG
ncbi:MAG: M50 family metallopeptidase [Candidatus Aenigmarchaeota archaeon]|nr:M50 family metallopeptidase [Candidatus Aenigmarchaeota archaeon]